MYWTNFWAFFSFTQAHAQLFTHSNIFGQMFDRKVFLSCESFSVHFDKYYRENMVLKEITCSWARNLITYNTNNTSKIRKILFRFDLKK